MKTRLFLIFSTIIIFLSLVVSKGYASACLSCPDKATYGSGVLVNNNGLDPSLSQTTYPQICAYSFSGQPYYFAPNSQTCSSSQKCDAKAGCIQSNAPPPSSCNKSGRTCTSDGDCGGAACSGYHCILGGYIIPPGAPANSGATCKYMPNAQPAPGSGNSGNTGSNSNPPGLGSGAYGGGTSLQDVSNFLNNPPGRVPSGGYSTLSKAIRVFLSLLIIAAIILTLFLLLWSGLDWMTSGGDKQKLHQAKQKLTFAIIGLVVVLLAFFIINLITNFFRVTTPSQNNPLSSCNPRIQRCPL